MPTNNKDHAQGIEQLFPLIGDSRYDYRFGFFTTEDTPGCHFRISFNKNSELYASGVEPELIIIIDTKRYIGEEVKGKLEEKRYCFVGRNDYDEQKRSWFFPIKDKDLYEISEADCITAIEVKKKRFRLDLFTESPDIWSAFFRAGVAECINEEMDSRELREFCLQYGLAKKKHQLEKTIYANNTTATYLADLMASPEGSIDMILL